MDTRHKNKAIVGLVVWGIALTLAISALVLSARLLHSHDDSRKTGTFVAWACLTVVQYVAYFWGGSHLARAKGYSNAIIVVGIFLPAQLVVVPLLLFALPDKCSNRSSLKPRRHHSERESPIARVVRYRRNALLACCLGLGGIFVALTFVFMPRGLFESYDNACVAAIFVFVPSYASVIYGGWWWVRAKHWPDAVILIGLLPLVVLFIPYVRLLYRHAPLLLPAGMVIMPVILLAVIAVLPDKSGMPKRQRWDRD